MRRLSTLLLVAVLAANALAHAQVAPQRPLAGDDARAAMARETAADYAEMQRVLGITAMRPGPSGNPTAPNAANSDEATANPFTDIPDPLVFNDGTRVSARTWPRRRLELLEHFSREVYGRVPRHVPRVTWREVRRVSMNGGRRGRDRPRTGGPRRQPSRSGHHGGDHPHAGHAGRGHRSGVAGDHVPRGRPAWRPAAAVARRVPAARPATRDRQPPSS